MHHPAPVVWNLTKKIPLNYTDYHCSISYKTGWLRELRRKSTKLYHFGGPWVRIQAQTENVSVIFFCKDFSTFSYLKLASDIFGGVHKQCGLSKGRERGCCTTYVIIQFDVQSWIYGFWVEISDSGFTRDIPTTTVTDHRVNFSSLRIYLWNPTSNLCFYFQKEQFS